MENASKALLFAAGILIAIILISVAVYIVSMSNEATEGVGSQMTEMQLKAFNQKFAVYEGIRTGSQVKSLVDVVNSSNATETEKVTISNATGCTAVDTSDANNYKFSGNNSKKYKVELTKTGSAVTAITISNT